MRASFRLKALPSAPILEQDVKITTQTVKDVKVQVGDIVVVQCTAEVSGVYSDGAEVDLANLTPVKIVGVKRG